MTWIDAGALAAQFVAQLAQRLDERQALDIADGAADLAQHEVKVSTSSSRLGAREFLDRVGDVRDHLHRRAEIVAAALLGDDLLVDPARW